MTFKQKVYDHYLRMVIDKINMLQNVLADLKETGANETKSTAGDKHETALAMIQIEQQNKRAQLDEVYLQKAALEKINPAISSAHILPGSLIKTNRGWLFLSIALGKATIDNVSITALSPQSPLGIKLIGLTVSDAVEINNNQFIIESIL